MISSLFKTTFIIYSFLSLQTSVSILVLHNIFAGNIYEYLKSKKNFGPKPFMLNLHYYKKVLLGQLQDTNGFMVSSFFGSKT